jgi:drug/metabolite transporter (DMT)-like permease
MLPHALLIGTVIIWGWTFVATKILIAEIGPVEILSLRLAIGLPFLGAILLAKRVPLQFGRGDVRPLLLGGAIFTTHILVQTSGLQTTTATNTGWIISVSPLVLAVLSYFLLGERIGKRGAAGIAIATLGVLLLVSRGRLGDLSWLQHTGDWLVLASAHTWAFYTVATRSLARRRPPLAVTFGILLIATAASAVLALTTGDFSRVASLSPQAMVAVLFLAIPGQALGQWFWQEGVAKLGATRAGLYLYLEPLATLALAVPLLGERAGLATLIGGGLILAGVSLAQRRTNA